MKLLFFSVVAFFQHGLVHESTRLNDDVLSTLGRQGKCLIYFFRVVCEGHAGEPEEAAQATRL